MHDLRAVFSGIASLPLLTRLSLIYSCVFTIVLHHENQHPEHIGAQLLLPRYQIFPLLHLFITPSTQSHPGLTLLPKMLEELVLCLMCCNPMLSVASTGRLGGGAFHQSFTVLSLFTFSALTCLRCMTDPFVPTAILGENISVCHSSLQE